MVSNDNFHRLDLSVMRKIIPIILVFGLLTSCGEDSCEIPDEIASIPVDIEIERLEDIMFSMGSKNEMRNFLDENPILETYFLASDQYPHDSILINSLYSRIQDPYIDTLLQETRNEFRDLEDLKSELISAFQHLKYFYPDIETPKVQTMVTGFGSAELFVSDSLIIIGLDYYIGPNATFRPIEIPDYILKRYRREYIVPAIILLLSNEFVQEDYTDRTLLADMLYYGKKYEFTKEMMPCTADSLIVWYTSQQISDVEENEDIIWANFVANQLLYETNHFTKTKYMDERPTVYEIGDKCPGRIGAWLGWQIIQSYMEKNSEMKIQDLMNNKSASVIFNNSGYKPDR